jgi:hypothetical protein
VDTRKVFEIGDALLPGAQYQWVGRTRSPGESAVGYLTFVIRAHWHIPSKRPDGVFVSVYDSNMVAHECIGNFWNTGAAKSAQEINDGEKSLVQRALSAGKTSSRLTGGSHTGAVLPYYSITYLFRENPDTTFVRGWHGVKMEFERGKSAFYLPSVFLKHTFENGTWIQKDDTQWTHAYRGKTQPASANWDFSETTQQLQKKAGSRESPISIVLYRTESVHKSAVL